MKFAEFLEIFKNKIFVFKHTNIRRMRAKLQLRRGQKSLHSTSQTELKIEKGKDRSCVADNKNKGE